MLLFRQRLGDSSYQCFAAEFGPDDFALPVQQEVRAGPKGRDNYNRASASHELESHQYEVRHSYVTPRIGAARLCTTASGASPNGFCPHGQSRTASRKPAKRTLSLCPGRSRSVPLWRLLRLVGTEHWTECLALVLPGVILQRDHCVGVAVQELARAARFTRCPGNDRVES